MPSTKSKIFESLVDESERSVFLNGGTLVDDGQFPTGEPTDDRFESFGELDPDSVLLKAIRHYVSAVLPKPKGLLGLGLWSITCLPSGRMFTLNVPGIEALFGYLGEDGPGVCMNLAYAEMPPSEWEETALRIGLEPDDFVPANYRKQTVSVRCLAHELARVLDDPAIVVAARTFVVDAMYAGGDPYRRYLSVPLATAVLSPNQ